MAIEDLSNVDPDMIMKLMKEDRTFMYRLDLVKDKIRTNLDVYADSIADAEFGMFEQEELDEISEAKSTIMNSWKRFEERLNVNIIDNLDFTPDEIQEDGTINRQEKDSASGVFEKETPSFILESFGDNAISQIKDAIQGKETPLAIGDSFASGDVKKGMFGTLMGTILGNMGIKVPTWLSGIAKSAGAAAPVVLFAGGVIWAAMDGIRGFMNSDAWGVSKISAVLGSVIGGVDSGLKNSMMGMGKWALIGAGIGSAMVPGVGTLLGGVIGGVFGAIAGWIGGERISQAFDKIGAWLSQKWSELTVGFQDGIVTGLGYFFGNLYSKWVTMWIELGIKLKNIFSLENMTDFINKIPEFLSKVKDALLGWLDDGWSVVKKFGKGIASGFSKEIEDDVDRYYTEKVMTERASGTPNISPKTENEEFKKYQDEIAKTNIIMVNLENKRERDNKELLEIQKMQLEYSKQLLHKPVSSGISGGSNVSLDMGEIRESTTDAAYIMRQQYHMR